MYSLLNSLGFGKWNIKNVRVCFLNYLWAYYEKWRKRETLYILVSYIHCPEELWTSFWSYLCASVWGNLSFFSCGGNFRIRSSKDNTWSSITFKGVSLILPPSYSSVKSETTLLNAEEIVSVYLCFQALAVRRENCNCCSTSIFALIFDILIPILIWVDGKEIKGLFFLLLLWGEINNQHLVGIFVFCFPWARSAGMQHLLLLHEQHPSLWVGMSVLPGRKLWRYGCLWPPKRHTKFVVVIALLEVPSYPPLVPMYIKITCVFIHSFGMEQDEVWSYKLWLPVHCCGAVVPVLHSVLWEYVK